MKWSSSWKWKSCQNQGTTLVDFKSPSGLLLPWHVHHSADWLLLPWHARCQTWPVLHFLSSEDQWELIPNPNFQERGSTRLNQEPNGWVNIKKLPKLIFPYFSYSCPITEAVSYNTNMALEAHPCGSYQKGRIIETANVVYHNPLLIEHDDDGNSY